MRLVVTGTREGRPDVWYWLDRWLARHGAPELVILGGARGVDSQAEAWALERVGRKYMHIERVHDWRDAKTGKKDPYAGFRRNQRMVDKAGRGAWCVGLPLGKSPGTWDCVDRAWQARLWVATCPLYWPGAFVNPQMYRPTELY